jgi:radical SAM protein with 4Fe4S-binding SPASM domain
LEKGDWKTYVKVQGQWKYLYRAVDRENNTIDFLLTAKRDKKAARWFLNKAIKSSGESTKINVDKSGANTAAIESYNKDNCTTIKIRQYKYLSNIVEQNHRFIKKKVRSTLGFKKFHAAQATIAGVKSLENVTETFFINLWKNNSVLNKLRNRNSLNGKCDACHYRFVCEGCRAFALHARIDMLTAMLGECI